MPEVTMDDKVKILVTGLKVMAAGAIKDLIEGIEGVDPDHDSIPHLKKALETFNE